MSVETLTQPDPIAWLTDRSRLQEGTDHCQMARYWHYHHLGWGIELNRPALDPWIGIAVHDMLAAAIQDPQHFDKPDLGTSVILKRAALWENRFKILCAKRRESEHTTREASWFSTILAVGWWQMFSTWLHENFDVIAIEEEFVMDLDGGRVRLMSRPDLVLENRQSKRISILDWKTMASFDPVKTSLGYSESVQMALLTAVVEKALGEPVEDYWIAGLVKGSKKHFEKDEFKTPERRFYSHLCYGSAPKAPFFKEWSTKGYWYHKAPVWEHMDVEAWLGILDAKDEKGNATSTILRDTFPMMGPFRRQTHMIPQAIRQLVGTENRFISGLWQLSQANEDSYWPTLDITFDRSYGNCTSYYGDECPYKTLCFNLPGSEDPIGSGLYRVRRPHHQPELEAMARVTTVPPEAWEVPAPAVVASTT